MRSAAIANDMSGSPGRNDPCHCGSGKKFKHCHGALSEVPTAVTGVRTLTAQEIGALVALLESGRPREAEERALELLKVHAGTGIVWKILSVALVRQRKNALPALRRTVELMPRDAEALRNLGAALHDQGDWAPSLEILQRSLALEPEHPDALLDAADALRGLGRARESLPLYRRALTHDPALVEAQNNLGNAYLELAEPVEAAACYRRALELRPGDAQIVGNLSNALRQTGELEEAARLGAQATALDPTLGVAHNNLGLALAALGRRAEAVASYRRALELTPNDVDTLNNLGNALRELGDRRAAVPLYARAIEVDPNRADSRCNLGNVLFELREVEPAIDSYRQALARHPGHAPSHLGLAFALRQQRRPAEAEASCRAALAIDPDYVEALAFLGELRADRGEFSEAEPLFRRALELNPGFPHAYASIATHRKMTRGDAQWLAGARALLERPLPLGHEISLCYALGKYFDDVKEYDEAFAHYRQANELSKRYGRQYDPSRLTARVDAIIGSLDAAWLRRMTPYGTDSELPVLIIGMPRSGTSLAEQILASHRAAFGAGELTFWNSAYEAYREAEQGGTGTELIPHLAADYLKQLTGLSPDSRRVIDKMPANFMYAGFIHAALPRARIIHMQRDPIDTCVSIYFQNFFNIAPYANDLDNLAHYYREYRRITEHWRALLPPSALLEVPYEGLIADQEGWTRRMLDFIGLPWDPACLEFEKTSRVVITASKWQVRQRISTASLGRWRNYEPHLAPLKALTDR